jgi:hypothetical protein
VPQSSGQTGEIDLEADAEVRMKLLSNHGLFSPGSPLMDVPATSGFSFGDGLDSGFGPEHVTFDD